MVDGRPAGIAASSFTSVSLLPPLVSVCIANTSTTWPQLRKLAHIGVSVLSDAHDDACRRLAGKNGNRFEGLAVKCTPDDAVLIEDAPAWLDCVVESELPAGDHAIVLMRICALSIQPDVAPLVIHRGAFCHLQRALVRPGPATSQASGRSVASR
jgi:flavin reductase (DIM6/NTAB) family NADH-FMN oxidoreductase RutF